MKKIIYIGIFIGSIVGSWISSLWGAGMFSFSGFIVSGVFSIGGGYLAFWIYQRYF